VLRLAFLSSGLRRKLEDRILGTSLSGAESCLWLIRG